MIENKVSLRTELNEIQVVSCAAWNRSPFPLSRHIIDIVVCGDWDEFSSQFTQYDSVKSRDIIRKKYKSLRISDAPFL